MKIDTLLRQIKRLTLQCKPYGFSGHYPTWEEAQKHSRGYDDGVILQKVIDATLAVQQGKAAYERDSVLFYEKQYDWFVMTALLHVYSQNHKLNVVDFGGALGSIYFQHKFLLDPLQSLEWRIVEQTTFTEAGKKQIHDDRLFFDDSLSDAFSNRNIDLVMFRCVLPYLEHPYEILEETLRLKPAYILIDRNPFIEGKDRICVQKVPKSIVDSSYPAHFFNKNKMLDFLTRDYEVVFETFDQETVNIRCSYDGMLLRRKSQTT
jgi:putative methyltransferase (TIGR04325 family)